LMGLVLWWPGRGAWTRSLKINWTSRPRLVLRDLHNAGGAYLSIFLLLSAITVPPIIWKLTTPQGGPPQTGQQARETSPPSGGPPTSISWQAAVDAAKAAVPGQWVGFVLRPLGPAPFYMIRVWPPGETGTPQMTTVFVNRYTGSIIRISSPSSLTLTRLISSDYLISLHSGAIAGLPGRLIMFIAGLGFAVLFASGLATWLIRLSSKNKSRPPSDITN
jgi:sulfite reductase (NADPH) flavoprotein alpha-component